MPLFHGPLFPGQGLQAGLQRLADVVCVQKQFGKCRPINSISLLARGTQW